MRPDNQFEVLRRHNAMGRARGNIAFMAGLSEEAFSALSQSLNSAPKRALSPYFSFGGYCAAGAAKRRP